MPAELVRYNTETDAALAVKRDELADVRLRLAALDRELAQLRTRIRAFEVRYMQQVGTLYAELDEIHARTAELQATLSPSDEAIHLAQEARAHARDTREAAALEEAPEANAVEPAPGLKALFRDVARRIHPDLARDGAEREYFTVLMARANHAYSCGDTTTLQHLLDDHVEINAVLEEKGTAAEVLRVTRQIRHAERDIARLDLERNTLFSSEMTQLYLEAEAAAEHHRDLLEELAEHVRAQITEAERHFALLQSRTECVGQ